MNEQAALIRARVGAVVSDQEHMRRAQERKAKLEPVKHRLRAASQDALARAMERKHR